MRIRAMLSKLPREQPAAYPRAVCGKLKLGSTQPGTAVLGEKQNKTKTVVSYRNVAMWSMVLQQGEEEPFEDLCGDETYLGASPQPSTAAGQPVHAWWLTLGPSTGTAATWAAELLSESKLGSHIRICKGLYTRCSP